MLIFLTSHHFKKGHGIKLTKFKQKLSAECDTQNENTKQVLKLKEYQYYFDKIELWHNYFNNMLKIVRNIKMNLRKLETRLKNSYYLEISYKHGFLYRIFISRGLVILKIMDFVYIAFRLIC